VLYGAGHNDTFALGGGAYLAQVRGFLDWVAPDAASAGSER